MTYCPGIQVTLSRALVRNPGPRTQIFEGVVIYAWSAHARVWRKKKSGERISGEQRQIGPLRTGPWRTGFVANRSVASRSMANRVRGAGSVANTSVANMPRQRGRDTSVANRVSPQSGNLVELRGQSKIICAEIFDFLVNPETIWEHFGIMLHHVEMILMVRNAGHQQFFF